MIQEFNSVRIAGINAAVPHNVISISDLVQGSDKQTASKIRRTAMLAGLKTRPVALENTSAKDLAVLAGRELLKNLDWNTGTVNAIFFVTETPDFLMPATGYFIHHELGLLEECVVTDVIASCSGLIQGIWTAASHLSATCTRILVFSGGTMSKTFLSDDIGNQILFGDAVGAIALEFNPNQNEPITFNLTSHPDVDLVLAIHGSGVRKTEKPKGFSMLGEKVMEFSQTKTVENISELLNRLALNIDDIEVFFSHQPNLALLESLQRKLGFPREKVPSILDSYGNCSSASIALLLSDYFQKNPNKSFSKALFCGFGGGLAVASMLAPISASQCFPIVRYEQ